MRSLGFASLNQPYLLATLPRMPARVFWALYLVLAFGFAPAIVRLRFGRWPFAYALRRTDAYLWIDFA